MKFSAYIGVKWLCIYVYTFSFREGVGFTAPSANDIVFTFVLLLILPVAEIIVLILPFRFALRQEGWKVIVLLIGAFALELALGWVMTSQTWETWMFAKFAWSVVLFLAFYKTELVTRVKAN